uniref:diphthine methyl ester synthase n=1 Tax=Heligmosomoides polygyrus TaxID=6339 RepID=A0A183FTE5_HELPZ
LDGAHVDDVAMLVVGDPFGATTHADLVLRAKQRNIPVKIIHNTSIMNAVGCCGLQLYNFGETVSIVMWLDGWEPDSYYDRIASNMEKGLHTLCLLDIKTKEQSIENMMKGRRIYEPPRYLTCAEAASQLLKIAERKREAGVEPVYNASSPCVGLARVGWDDQKIVFCTLKEMSEHDLGPPLHSMILPGHMHPLEVDMLNTFKISDEKLS